MSTSLYAFLALLLLPVRSRFSMQLEILALRRQRRVLRSYFSYYHDWRTHLSLEMDCPEPRPGPKVEAGEIVEVPEVGGLHHYYERRVA